MSLTIPRNSFGTLETPPDTISNGSKNITKAGDAEQLTTTSTACRKSQIEAVTFGLII